MNTSQTIEQMKSLDSKVFRKLGLEIANQLIRSDGGSEDAKTALINYNNWDKAQKQRFLESMK